MTIDVFMEIISKKIYTEVTKACIRRDYPPHIAEWKCNCIDMAERAEHIDHVAAMMLSVRAW